MSITLSDLGVEPVETHAEAGRRPAGERKTRRIIGLSEARAAGATETTIHAVAREALCEVHRDGLPVHIGLLLDAEEPQLELLNPTAKEQHALKVGLLRLANLLTQGVHEETAASEAVRPPAVFREPATRVRRLWRDAGLPRAVHVRPGNPKATRTAELVARRVVMRRDRYARSGWTRDGFLVDRGVALQHGLVSDDA